MKRYLLVPLAGVLLAGCGAEMAGPLQHETKSVPLDKSELVRVDIKMGAGELQVRRGSSMNLMDATFDYNVASWKPVVNYRSTGVRSDLEILQPQSSFATGNTRYDWTLELNDGVLLDVIAKLGAGEAKMTLGDLRLRSVDVSIGAGEVDMDLRGATPARSYDVRIQGGVGQATVHLPRDVGIYATAQGGIGEINVRGLQKRGDHWENELRADSPITIRVDVKGGVGEIDLVAE